MSKDDYNYWQSPSIGHNKPPVDDGGADEVRTAILAAHKAASIGASNKLEADRLGDIRDQLTKLSQKTEKDRKAEKEPFLEGGRAVDAKFSPVLTGIDEALKLVKAELTKYLLIESDRLKKEAAEKAEKELAARLAAEALNAPAPPKVAVVPQPEKPRAGTIGRATGLREFKSAMIIDYPALLQSLADNSEIKALAQSIANNAARSGVALPGCKINVEMRVA